LAEFLFGRRLDPLALGVLASALVPVAFVTGLFSGRSLLAAAAFAFLYGAGNGLLTITRGTQPLILFEPHAYGTIVGRLIAPGFFLSALAPVLYAAIIARFGQAAALHLSTGVGLLACLASLALWLRFRGHRTESSKTSLGRLT
jgi:hypothetical protein